MAFIHAMRASRSAAEARKAVYIRNLSEEMHLACIRAEELIDFLITARFPEAALRGGELTSTLSELPFRRSPYLAEGHRNVILTARQQLASISEAILAKNAPGQTFDSQRAIIVARQVASKLREILGIVRGRIERGE